MNALSKTILADWQVRKTRAQKTAFIEFMQENIPDLRIEQSGLFRSRNLIVGDVDHARILLTAHYDTCARLPFPNLIAPRNLPVTLLYSLLICVPFLIALVGVNLLLSFVTDSTWVRYWLSLIAFLALYLGVFMFGRPNPHTANDNTSGVVTLCELLGGAPDGVAFAFFDNEEYGLIGSSLFRRMHRKALGRMLVINFDCVSDGDTLLLVQSAAARRRFGAMLEDAYRPADGKAVRMVRASTTLYPSDQMGFPVGVGVAALKRKPLIGLYLDRIHTKRDTAFDQRNIELLCEGTRRFWKNEFAE